MGHREEVSRSAKIGITAAVLVAVLIAVALGYPAAAQRLAVPESVHECGRRWDRSNHEPTTDLPELNKPYEWKQIGKTRLAGVVLKPLAPGEGRCDKPAPIVVHVGYEDRHWLYELSGGP